MSGEAIMLLRPGLGERLRGTRLDVLPAVAADGEAQIWIGDGDRGVVLLELPAHQVEYLIETLREAQAILADRPARPWYGGYDARPAAEQRLLDDVRHATSHWKGTAAHTLPHGLFQERLGVAQALLSAVAAPADRHWLGFSEEEWNKIRHWQGEHICPAVEPGASPGGCFGDQWSYVVHPTSVGTMYDVRCSLCGAKLQDITDLAGCW